MSASEPRPTPQLTARLRAVTLGRLTALIAVTLLMVATGGALVDPEGWDLLGWAGAGYLATSLAILLLADRPRPQRLALDVSLVVDAAVLGVVLAVTGGPASPLAFLLYAEVVSLTLVFGWWTGVRSCLVHSLALVWVATTGPPSLASIVEVVSDNDLALASALEPAVRTVLLLLGLWFVAGLVALLSSVTERELRGLVDDLALLREVNHGLDSSQDLPSVCDGIAATLVTHFDYARAVVWLADDEEGFVPNGSAGLEELPRAEMVAAGMTAGGHPLGDAIRSGEPWPVRRQDPRPRGVERLLGTETALVLVPLAREGRLLGLIGAEVPRRPGRPPRLRQRDLRLLSMLAGEASLVLDNARLHAELRKRAVTDSLTGLPNHGFFQQRVEEELERSQRRRERDESGPLSVVLLDLDHFKEVNDTFGHPAGDRVLKSVARTAHRVLRGSDVVCRYGGEEFGFVLPDTTAEQAVRACDRVRRALQTLDVRDDDGQSLGRVTASFGVASLEGDGPVERAALVGAADAALYEAKEAGRDRVVQTTLTPPRHRHHAAGA